jgi:murein DD-endopeptidase MepM/ murein hydrolase activator NlpD
MLLPFLALLVAGPVRFDPERPAVGDLVVLYFDNTDVSVDRGTASVLGYEIALFRVSASMMRGVAAVPLDIAPGSYPVEGFVGDKVYRAEIEVVDRVFETSELTVSRRFTQKKTPEIQARLRREERQFRRLWDAPPTFPKQIGKSVRPVPGIKTSSFGSRRVFNGKRKSTHYGLDLDAKVGVPIVAAFDGQVVLSAMRWASGGTIVLDHGGGLFSLYFHMSRRDRRVGDWVKKGEVLGAAGKTGRVTGPHLHLAVVVRSVRLSGPKKGQPRSMYVEPERFLELDFLGHPSFVRLPVEKIADQR